MAAEHQTTLPLSELKVVVHPEMPPDELWVHPAMYDLLKKAFLEADSQRGITRDV